MDHVVKLAYAHSALADPVFPRLYGQARWFRSLDLAPEVVSFAGEKVTLPEDSTKQFVRIAWEIACFEQNGGLLFRGSTSSSTRHRKGHLDSRELILPLILVVAHFARLLPVSPPLAMASLRKKLRSFIMTKFLR